VWLFLVSVARVTEGVKMTEIHTYNGAVIDNQRHHVQFPVCYVVCTDTFMSGWGLAAGGRDSHGRYHVDGLM